MAFLNLFFPLELREAKLVEFMNLKQGGMSVREYALKFNQLSKYAPHLVANFRSRMNKFVMGVFDLVSEECRSTMLISDMDLFRLITYVEQMEEEKLKKRRGHEAKRAYFEVGFKRVLDINKAKGLLMLVIGGSSMTSLGLKVWVQWLPMICTLSTEGIIGAHV